MSKASNRAKQKAARKRAKRGPRSELDEAFRVLAKRWWACVEREEGWLLPLMEKSR